MVIYTLSGPDEVVRYVGKTSRADVSLRLREHVAEAKRGRTHKERWILSLGCEPTIAILEECCGADVDERERFWISQFGNLTNGTEGGDGGAMSAEVVAKRNAAIKRGYEQGRSGPFLGKAHSASTKSRMSSAARARIARGDSPICSPDHQRAASAKSSKGKGRVRTVEQRREQAERMKRWWAERKAS